MNLTPPLVTRGRTAYGDMDPRWHTAPNIIIVVTDDFGVGDVATYGASSQPVTPHMDSLATDGIKFDRHYVQPTCTPTRFELLSGQHVARSGGLDNPITIAETERGWPSGVATLADFYQAREWPTALIGKWHLGHGGMTTSNPPTVGASDTEYHPLNHGFDYFYGALAGAIDYHTHWYLDTKADFFEDREYVTSEIGTATDRHTYATYLFRDKAVNWIGEKANTGKPFFLYLPFTEPHWAAVTGGTELDRVQLPDGELTEREYLSRLDGTGLSDDTVRKRNLAKIAILDDTIGAILDKLDTEGITNDTIVLFLSDNGGDTTYGGDNGTLRGEKFSPYEAGIRTPAMLKWPAKISGGQTQNQLIAAVDWLPTLIGMAEYGQPDGTVDGADLSAHLLAGTTTERDYFSENSSYGNVFIRGDWKWLDSGSGDELYNLASDPTESTNLAGSETAKLSELKTAWSDYKTAQGI